MAFEQLTPQEQEIIGQAMYAMLHGPWTEDWEFQTRLGVDRLELRDILATWPRLEDANNDSGVALAINNCLNELLHGVFLSAGDWSKWFNLPREDVKKAYLHWARLEGDTEAGLR